MIEQKEKIQTLSLVSGTEACNARCPFCVSKMTPTQGVEQKLSETNWKRFDTAFAYATDRSVETVMITSKGEGTLFPQQITDYLSHIDRDEQRMEYIVPHVELQTNGIIFQEKEEKYNPLLRTWKNSGLDTVAISVVHDNPDINKEIYLPYKDTYISLPGVIDQIHGHDLRVRLACIMFQGGIDSRETLEEMIEFAREKKVEELTFRPVNKPEVSRNKEVYQWIAEHQLRPDQHSDMSEYLDKEGILKDTLPFGAKIYDVRGQNVCMTNSLTKNTSSYHRQLIFYPNGIITHDWTENQESVL